VLRRGVNETGSLPSLRVHSGMSADGPQREVRRRLTAGATPTAHSGRYADGSQRNCQGVPLPGTGAGRLRRAVRVLPVHSRQVAKGGAPRDPRQFPPTGRISGGSYEGSRHTSPDLGGVTLDLLAVKLQESASPNHAFDREFFGAWANLGLGGVGTLDARRVLRRQAPGLQHAIRHQSRLLWFGRLFSGTSRPTPGAWASRTRL
jgi:hypothetical protein